ncbi:hypothetical protein PG993_001012 [Apiospora rasikravindrae]|uniref:Uncharacterized protein n=1 Tax=Apiospora rasikravindrae TaxID=990691 RepID=A0ABR1UA86_9PEZI
METYSWIAIEDQDTIRGVLCLARDVGKLIYTFSVLVERMPQASGSRCLRTVRKPQTLARFKDSRRLFYTGFGPWSEFHLMTKAMEGLGVDRKGPTLKIDDLGPSMRREVLACILEDMDNGHGTTTPI